MSIPPKLRQVCSIAFWIASESFISQTIDKALSLLNWNAVMGFEDTVRMTAKWYSDFYNNPKCIADTTDDQIEEYINLAKLEGLDWAK